MRTAFAGHAKRHQRGGSNAGEGGSRRSAEACLIDQGASELVLVVQDLGPQIRLHALDDVACLNLEEAVPVGAVDKRIVAVPPLVCGARQVGVPLLTVLANHQRVIVGVGGQEVLWVVVGIDDDFAQSVVHGGVLAALAHQMLQEGVQQLQSVALLHLCQMATV